MKDIRLKIDTEKIAKEIAEDLKLIRQTYSQLVN
nr:MAG TPA: YozD-like protein [Caudoviricetes sp.]